MSRAESIRLTRILPLALALLCLLTSVSKADVVGSYDTQGCPVNAPIWRIHYDLYWSNAAGVRLDQAQMQSVLDAMGNFAQDVGLLTECSVRVHVDIESHSDPYTYALEPVDGGGYMPPTPDGYDAEFTRVPATDPLPYSGLASLSSALFPVVPGSAETGSPWELLLMHEWLHTVVNFYTAPMGWPNQDVHGACYRSDYPDGGTYDGLPIAGCMVDPHWFHDLMTGEVSENGQLKGLPRDQWAYQGTPTHPHHVNPQLSVTYSGGSKPALNITTAAPYNKGASPISAYSGPLTVTVTSPAGGTTTATTTFPSDGRYLLPPTLVPGKYRACVSTNATDEYLAATSCVSFTVVRYTVVGSAASLAKVSRLHYSKMDHSWELTVTSAFRLVHQHARFDLLGLWSRVCRSRGYPWCSFRVRKTGSARLSRVTTFRIKVPRDSYISFTVTVPSFRGPGELYRGFSIYRSHN